MLENYAFSLCPFVIDFHFLWLCHQAFCDCVILKTFTEGIKSSEKIETNSHQSGWYRQHIHESSWWFENVDNTYSVTDVIAAREREKKRQHYTSVAFPIQKTKHSITHDWILSLLDTTRDNLLRQLGQMYFLFKSKYSARPTIAHTHTQIHITDTQNILDSFSIVSKRRRVLFIVSTHNVFFFGYMTLNWCTRLNAKRVECYSSINCEPWVWKGKPFYVHILHDLTVRLNDTHSFNSSSIELSKRFASKTMAPKSTKNPTYLARSWKEKPRSTWNFASELPNLLLFSHFKCFQRIFA